MIATYPQVPTGYDLGINCAVESYDGKLFFGLIADAQVASDVTRLRDFLYDSFQELRAAARKQARAAARATGQPKEKGNPSKGAARRQPSKPTQGVSRVIAKPAAAGPRARIQPVEAVSPMIPQPGTGGPPPTTPAPPAGEAKNAA